MGFAIDYFSFEIRSRRFSRFCRRMAVVYADVFFFTEPLFSSPLFSLDFFSDFCRSRLEIMLDADCFFFSSRRKYFSLR